MTGIVTLINFVLLDWILANFLLLLASFAVVWVLNCLLTKFGIDMLGFALVFIVYALSQKFLLVLDVFKVKTVFGFQLEDWRCLLRICGKEGKRNFELGTNHFTSKLNSTRPF